MLLTSLSPCISKDDPEQSQTNAFKGILSQLSVLLDSVTAMNVSGYESRLEIICSAKRLESSYLNLTVNRTFCNVTNTCSSSRILYIKQSHGIMLYIFKLIACYLIDHGTV